MANVPINAQVECTDGSCGKSTHLIVNPVNHKVSHFVLQDKSLPDNPTRLVPAGNVVSATQQQITLNCTKSDVAKMPPFIVSSFVRRPAPGNAYSPDPVYAPRYVIGDTAYDEVQELNIPEGGLALHSGMHVEATDGHLGKAHELVVDPNSGEITHLLMREGHLWSKKDVTIQVAAIDFVDADNVYLKLDKAAVEALPAVPVRRP
jgi:hypothetical protein